MASLYQMEKVAELTKQGYKVIHDPNSIKWYGGPESGEELVCGGDACVQDPEGKVYLVNAAGEVTPITVYVVEPR